MNRLTLVSVSYALAPVGPDAVGGAEQVLSLLDRALCRRGHRSIVIAPSGSELAGEHVDCGAIPRALDDQARAEAGRRQAEVLRRTLGRVRADLVHLHSVDFVAAAGACGGTPSLATLHLPVDHYAPAALAHGGPAALAHYGSAAGGPLLQFVSRAQRRGAPAALQANPVIENGADMELFRPSRRRQAFALALGRICPEKRFDRALRAARRARVPLLLGGRVYPYPEHERHFANALAPLLGSGARFLGPVGLARKRRLLAAARCLVVTSAVAETSSLVAIEALASGTPVVAWRSGALPEIIDHGRTGFLVDSEEQLADAIVEAAALDGAVCRADAERRFSSERMVDEYLALYARLLEQARGAAA